MTPEEIWQQYAAAYGVDSVEAFQRFFGLMETGLLDTDTANALIQPRCGLRDNLVVISEAKWRKRKLNWFVERYLNGLPPSEQDNIYAEGWNSWAQVCDLKFEQVRSIAQADVILSTGSGRPDGFDGPSGTLAWMTLGTNNDNPILGRFDMGEQWVNDPNRDIYLLAVAAHEFGHALNLDHAPQNSGALMAPFYNRRVFKPTQHDIGRIQALYGPPQPVEPPPTGELGWLNKAAKGVMGRALTPLELGRLTNLAPDRFKQALELLGFADRHSYLATGWYRAFLRREPDPGGLANFVRALQAGLSHDHCIAVFLSSAEYRGNSQQSNGLDPQNPDQPTSPPTPDGGLMNFFRELLIQIVTAALEPFRRIPFLGRFITPELVGRIVDAVLRQLGPQATAIEAALQSSGQHAALTQAVDTQALIDEVSQEVGTVPTS